MSSDPLAEARRERDLILDRVTWWDTHRYSAIFPIAIGFFAAGYGLGVALKQFAGAPERTEVVLALGFLFLAGRFIERRYATAKPALANIPTLRAGPSASTPHRDVSR